MKTTGISFTETTDDDGLTCYEWGFDLNGEHFGGYGRTIADARNDAESVLGDAIKPLAEAGIDAAYESLVGYKPIKGEGMSLEDAAQLLFERMKEGE
jgi:hypothetical protein